MAVQEPEDSRTEPKFISVFATAEMLGVGRTKIFGLLGAGKIKAVKIGGSTCVDMESLRTFLAGLPPAKYRPHAPPKRRARS